jgi:hypothetical protein
VTAAALMLAALAAIAVGINLIYVAGDLAQKQKATEMDAIVGRLREIDGRRRDVIQKTMAELTDLSQIDQFIEYNNGQLKVTKAQRSKERNKEKRDELDNQIEQTEGLIRGSQDRLQTRDKLRAAAEARRDQELATLKDSEKSMNEELVTSSKGFEYNSLIIRVAAVLLIVFLVQTFITVFRYLTRLAAYYQGRVDSLQLAAGREISINDLRDLSSVFSPETYDFGKPPKSPSDQALDLAKAIITNLRREKEK